MLVLTANKTKMIRLVRSMGYNPTQNAEFTKAYRCRHWWLEWEDGNNSYHAVLSSHRGVAFLGMKQKEYGSSSPEKWTAWDITPAQLQEFELVEELVSKTRTAPQRREPDYEPEL